MTDFHPSWDATLLQKASRIRLLISDLDGVLTDGYLVYGATGEAYKSFHVHDGLGLRLLLLSGIEVGIITGSTTPVIAQRMQDLGVRHLFMGQLNKQQAYDTLLETCQVSPDQVAYVGDDWPDTPLLQQSGLGIAVANANPLVKRQADWTTRLSGGQGAIREVCDLILTAQNSLESAVQQFAKGTAG